MVHYEDRYVLLQGRVMTDGSVLLERVGNTPLHIFNRMLSSTTGVWVLRSEFVSLRLPDLGAGDEVEVLAKITWKEHHCIVSNATFKAYKIRYPKCRGTLHELQNKLVMGGVHK